MWKKATYMTGMTTTQPRKPARSPNSTGGQFAAHTRTLPDAAPLTRQWQDSYEVPTVMGTRTLVPGTWDWQTAQAFMNGQCVAFAAAVASRVGATEIEVLLDREEDRIIHAWVQDEDERVIDANDTDDASGWTSEEYVADRAGADWWENDNYTWETIDLDEVAEFAAHHTAHRNLPTQSWEAAEAMMDAFEAERARVAAEAESARAAQIHDRLTPALLARLAGEESAPPLDDGWAQAEARFRKAHPGAVPAGY